MPPKRKNQDTSESDAGTDFSPAPATAAPAKRSRGSTTASPSHTLDSLLALSHQDLASLALSLQTQLSLALQQSSSSNSSGADTWTEEKILERVKKTRDVCAAEIKKQMKWQPSCKTGTTKWSYTGIVPHEHVFYRLFGFERPKKAWKQKKIDMADFQDKIGYITNSIRYNTPNITGDGVKVHWDEEEKTFKLTGTYGL